MRGLAFAHVRIERNKKMMTRNKKLTGDLTPAHCAAMVISDGNILIRKIICSDAISKMAFSLSSALKQKGFAPDEKPFRPHITIARRAVFNKEDALRCLDLTAQTLDCEADGITLMVSERINGRLTYTPVRKVLF